MTPNNSPSRNLAFWRMEANAVLTHIDPATREQVAVLAFKLHGQYAGQGSPYGVHAALAMIVADRSSAGERRAAQAVIDQANADARAHADLVTRAHAERY